MIDVVMLAKGRMNLTKQAVESLHKNTLGKYRLWLMVDEHPSDDYDWIGKEALGSWSFFPCGNLSKLRNAGTDHILKAEWLYFSDNDVFFKYGWDMVLAVGLTCHQSISKRLSVLGGQNHPFHKPLQKWDMWPVGNYDLAVEEHSALAGTSMMMSWETWDQFGPFDETTANAIQQSEDHAFCQKIREAGYRVGAVVPHVVIDTSFTDSNGNPALGVEHKKRLPGILYE